MTRLTRKDNDILRKQEWCLLFIPGSSTPSSSSAVHAPSASQPQSQQLNTVPDDYAQDTFLVKAFFSETEKYYVVLLTNFKQTWYEKLELNAIRERSKLIRSFAYEEDAQLEALLLSLSTVFSTAHDTPATSTPRTPTTRSKQLLQGRHDKIYMIVGFEFGLAAMSWKFKLSPMIASTANVSRSLALKTAATYSQSPLFPTNLSQLIDDVGAGSESGADARANANGNNKRARRTFLEDSEDEYDENEEREFALDDEDELDDEQKNADGVSVLFDQLILPLIALNNAYRKQTRTLEAVIKNKESEVVEALELLEQHGIGYHNRRRATEKFDKARVDTKLQEDVEQLLYPQLVGPRELFADKKVANLCTIVSRNAGEHANPSPSLLDRNMASQEVGLSQASSARRNGGGESLSLLKDVGASIAAPTVAPASGRNTGNPDGGANAKASIEGSGGTRETTLMPMARMATRTRIASMTQVRLNSTVVPSTPPASLNEGEKHLYSKLFEKFQPTKLVVEDISGGCGSMYQVEVVSSAFKDLNMVKQHRLVNETLKEEIKGMHGIRLTTKASA
ncbi:hypothetical protein EC991_005506 [Linnemannia zychae]|nr:hypothetical protein EC991_005506 [Linnemannia zychae]